MPNGAARFFRKFVLQVWLVQQDDKKLEKTMAQCVADGTATELLELWLDAAEHLDCLTTLLNCAMARSSMVLKRLGHDSGNADRKAKRRRAA